MDLVEFGGVCEVGVFGGVVVVPMGFSSETILGGQLMSRIAGDVCRGEKQDLTRQDSGFDERHRFFPRRILLNQRIRDIGRFRKDLFLEL